MAETANLEQALRDIIAIADSVLGNSKTTGGSIGDKLVNEGGMGGGAKDDVTGPSKFATKGAFEK